LEGNDTMYVNMLLNEFQGLLLKAHFWHKGWILQQQPLLCHESHWHCPQLLTRDTMDLV